MLKYYVALHSFLARRLDRDDRGATAVEYGMIVALIAAIIVFTVAALGTKIDAAFTTVVNNI